MKTADLIRNGSPGDLYLINLDELDRDEIDFVLRRVIDIRDNEIRTRDDIWKISLVDELEREIYARLYST